MENTTQEPHIYNNLYLNGGLKNREGFYRVVENNIMINGFHPHCWYMHSEDIVRRNIMASDQYFPASGMPDTPWGREIDNNLVNRDGVADPEPAVKLAKESRRDEHSIIARAMFIDPANGDFRVEGGSPALKLGFVNFPMDQFGVQKPELKAIARTPQMPNIGNAGRPAKKEPAAMRASFILQVKARNISGPGDRSAYGLPDETGVLILDVPADSPAVKAGLQKEDVIRSCNDQPVKTVADLQKIRDMAAGKKLTLSFMRKQGQINVELSEYTFSALDLRSQQNFVLYGSGAKSDPGWKVNDLRIFTPVISVDTRQDVPAAFEATSIRCSNDKPLGSYRWLVWVVFPVTQGNAENTAFQELQMLPAK